jgi:hypothetical protein
MTAPARANDRIQGPSCTFPPKIRLTWLPTELHSPRQAPECHGPHGIPILALLGMCTRTPTQPLYKMNLHYVGKDQADCALLRRPL